MKISSELTKEERFSLGRKPRETRANTIREFSSNGFPDDYVAFMTEHDGGEGFIGDQYVILYKAAEIPGYNRDYEIERFAPGFVLFGTNGGGEAFVFDTREGEHSVAMVPFIGISHNDAIGVGASFSDFVSRLIRRENLFD